MANVRGLPVSDLILHVQRATQDAGAREPSGPALLRLLNDAVRDLARDAGAFRRREIMPAANAVAEYVLQQHPERILRVRHGGARLTFRSEDALDASPDIGATWRTETGTPSAWTGAERVRLTPIPDADGDALAFAAASKLTTAEGYTITGHGYGLAMNGGSEVFYVPGDGTITNEATAAGLVEVEYAYTPDSLDYSTVIPNRFERALKEYALARVMPGDAAQGHGAAYDRERAQLAAGVIDPTWEFRHYDAAQRALAEGRDLPKLMADDYERIVHAALQEGDPAGRDFILNRTFLQEAVQQAIAEGKAVPREIRTQFERLVHDLEPYSREMEAALSFQFCQQEIQRCLAAGLPVNKIVLAAYLRQQSVQEAGVTRRSLRGELPI